MTSLWRLSAALLAVPGASGQCTAGLSCPEAVGSNVLLLQTGKTVEVSPSSAQHSNRLRASNLPMPTKREADRLPRWRWAWADAWPVPRNQETLSEAVLLFWNWLGIMLYALVVAYYPSIEAEERKKRGQESPRPPERVEEMKKEEEEGLGRLGALSGLRSPLIFLIYMHQSGIYMFSEVGAFFVLSGFLLSWSRRGRTPGTAKRPFDSMLDVLVFYSCRMVRVLPLYWVCFAASYVSPSHGVFAPLKFIISVCWNILALPLKHTAQFLLTSTRGGVWWFITCIIIHYALYPFAEMAITSREPPGQRWRAGVLLVAAAGAKIVDLVWLSDHMDMTSLTVFGVSMNPYRASVPFLDNWMVDHYYTPLCRLPEFFLGVALPHLPPPDFEALFPELYEQLSASKVWRRCPGMADLVGLAMAVIVLFTPCKALFLLLMDNNVLCFGHALLIYCLAFGSSYIGTILNWKPLVWHGELVFACYLVQASTLARLQGSMHMGSRLPNWPPDVGQVFGFKDCPFNVFFEACVGLLLATVCALALHHLVEKPCIQLWADFLSAWKLA